MNQPYLIKNQEGDLLIDFTKKICLLKNNNFFDLIVKDAQVLVQYGKLIEGIKPENTKSFLMSYETKSEAWKQAKRFVCLKRCKGYNWVRFDSDEKGVVVPFIDNVNIKEMNQKEEEKVIEVGSIKYPIPRISYYFPQNRVGDGIVDMDLYKMQKKFLGVFLIQEKQNQTHFVQIELLRNCLKVIQGLEINLQKAKSDIIRYKSNEEAEIFSQKILHDLVAIGFKRNNNYFQQQFSEKDLEKK